MTGIWYLDWPGTVAILGVASTLGAYWIQNRREERDKKKLTDRFNAFEKGLSDLKKTVDGMVHKKKETNGG